MSVWTIVVAAGSGQRYGGPKQFELINRHERVVDRSVKIAKSVSDGVIVVVPAPVGAIQPPVDALCVSGGDSRAESVRRGLECVPDDAQIIVVHDAARPLASEELYKSVIGVVEGGHDSAIPGVPVTDTVKSVASLDGIHSYVEQTFDRDSLIAVQTPQAFRASLLREAHKDSPESTDDATLVENIGGKVIVVVGEEANIKITSRADLEQVAARVSNLGQ